MMKKHKIPRVRIDYQAHALRLYSPTRLAGLFDVDPATIWRWRQEGLMPKPITLPSGKPVWTEPQIAQWLDGLQADQAEA